MFSKRLSQVDGIANNALLQIDSSGVAIKSTALTVTSGGFVGKPLTPMLVADATSSQSNVTGDGTSYVVLFPNIRFQSGGTNFNVGTGVYTCPASAFYYLSGSVAIGGIGAHNICNLWLDAGGSKYYTNGFNPNVARDANLNLVMSFGLGFRATLGDVIGMVLNVAGSTKTINVLGASPIITSLSIGMLV